MQLNSKPLKMVSAGTYAISRKRNAALDAILGTCIGVTICDKIGNVGGLIHLLLPEPTDPANPWHPEKYAATGLPMFIADLLSAGAKRERMRACIAGGALIDPVCDRDLSLDIGGRTFEIVQKVLRKERIPVETAETGGFFACRLTLDLINWESRIEPTYTETDLEKIPVACPSGNELSKAIDNAKPIPQVALKIMRMINESKYGLRDIAKNVCTDQVLSAKVLGFCNSAFLGLRKKVCSIEQALIFIGEKQILRMVVSLSLEKFFVDSARGYSLCKGGLYYHALGSAVVAETLAKISGKASLAQHTLPGYCMT